MADNKGNELKPMDFELFNYQSDEVSEARSCCCYFFIKIAAAKHFFFVREPKNFTMFGCTHLQLVLQPAVVLCEQCRSSNLVDPASSHMLVLKIKPCMSKYKYHTAKLRMAH